MPVKVPEATWYLKLIRTVDKYRTPSDYRRPNSKDIRKSIEEECTTNPDFIRVET